MDRVLYYVFAGSRGGPTRVRIMRALLDHPYNTHELAKELGLDYKTVEYQLRVLQKHVYAVKVSEGYGTLFAPSKNLLAVVAEFEAIAAGLRDRRGRPVRPRPEVGKPSNPGGPKAT